MRMGEKNERYGGMRKSSINVYEIEGGNSYEIICMRVEEGKNVVFLYDIVLAGLGIVERNGLKG